MNNFVIKNKKGTELTSLSAWEQGFIEVDDKKRDTCKLPWHNVT